MKPLKEPGYVAKRVHHQWHQVPGHGLCPACGSFARVAHTESSAEFKTQYRSCQCGNNFQTVVRIG